MKERVKSVLNYKKPAFWITIPAIIVCIIVAICFLTNPHREYSIRITIPAGSTEEISYQEDFCYSDAEISPTGHQIILSLGEGVGDTQVVLKPIEVKEENAYEPTYITSGMPVKMDVEKGAWFKIGVNMQNPTTEDITVYVSVRNVEVRIASDENAESSRPVHFSDGEDSSENEYFESERDYDAQASETAREDLQSELERVIVDIGLEHAYPWNNTVELKSDADVLIKMASDDTGRFEIYGIMSAKYGTCGLLLNDWIGGEQNWNFEFVPWYYSGAPSDQPILESDGNGNYIFAYVYQYEDGVPLWRECILDCGYDTGHMELISLEKAADNAENSVTESTMADTSIVSGIVVTNGNTGEEITLSADSAAYKELLKLYRQLDFTVEYEENTRVGYRYKMKLLDADGNKLQSVTPYKDGVTVDGIFFKYDNTGKDAVPSLSLMEYLEYLCNSVQNNLENEE